MIQIEVLHSRPAILIKNQNNWVPISFLLKWNISSLNHYLLIDITAITFTNIIIAAGALDSMYSISKFIYFHFESIKAYFISCLKLNIIHLNSITLHNCIIIFSNEAVSFTIRVFHKIIYLAYWRFQISTCLKFEFRMQLIHRYPPNSIQLFIYFFNLCCFQILLHQVHLGRHQHIDCYFFENSFLSIILSNLYFYLNTFSKIIHLPYYYSFGYLQGFYCCH